jgi:hypothetical protein
MRRRSDQSGFGLIVQGGVTPPGTVSKLST